MWNDKIYMNVWYEALYTLKQPVWNDWQQKQYQWPKQWLTLQEPSFSASEIII